jgi:NADH-quinone oxidoreductase subunit G
VLRVLGNVLHLAGFDDESSESVRDAVLSGGVTQRLSNQLQGAISASRANGAAGALERVTDVPIFRTDAMVRRAPALQEAAASRSPVARMHASTLAKLGVSQGAQVRIKAAAGEIVLAAELDNTLAVDAVRIAAGFEQTAALGSAFGQLSVERA